MNISTIYLGSTWNGWLWCHRLDKKNLSCAK